MLVEFILEFILIFNLRFLLDFNYQMTGLTGKQSSDPAPYNLPLDEDNYCHSIPVRCCIKLEEVSFT
jgi:hypothetical protein